MAEEESTRRQPRAAMRLERESDDRAPRKRRVPLTRLVLDGLNAALVHSETMMAPDPETFGRADWKRQEAARRWVTDQLQRRGLVQGEPE